MNKYKLIISDFDGTLTRHDHSLSPKVIEAVKKWIYAGNHFSIASGRQFAMIQREIEILEIVDPVIVRGGADIVDPRDGKLLYSKVMNAEDVQMIIQILREHDIRIMVEKGNTLYANTRIKTELPGIQYEELDNFPGTDSPKIVVYADDEKIEETDSVMQDIQKRFPGVHVVKSFSPHWNAWDITSADSTKHLAALELMKILDISREQTVGVGDGYNDFPLLEASGLKVAMGNANEELKAIADLQVPSYHDDGVAVLIDKLLDEKI